MLKKIGIPFAKIFISTGLIGFLIYKLNITKIVSEITSANIKWLFISVFIFTISNMLGALQWHRLLKIQNIELPFFQIISYYYVGLFFNHFLIGYVGGDAFRIYDVSVTSGKNSMAVSSVLLDRLIGFFCLSTLALFAALYWSHSIASPIVLSGISFTFIIWIVLFILMFKEKYIKILSRLFFKYVPTKIHAKLKEIYYCINAYKHNKIRLAFVLAISFSTQIFRILVHYTAALAIGVHIPVTYFIIFIPIIALLACLPISIGGIGVRESSAVAFFSHVWKVQTDIVAFEFLTFIIGIISVIPGGIIFMLRKEAKHRISKGEVIQ